MAKSREQKKNRSADEELENGSAGKVLVEGEKYCMFCVKLLRNPKDIESHESKCWKGLSTTEKIITKDGRKVFQCEICSTTIRLLPNLLRHKERHEPPGGYICRYCNEHFCMEAELIKHKKDKHKVFKCNPCNIIFKSDSESLEHINLIHEGVSPKYFLCENCGQRFSSKSLLKNHTESKCGAEKRFKCSECGLKYMTKGILKEHQIIHKNKKSFSCNYCDQKFICRYRLNRHIRTHTGEKPYSCEICSKSFSHHESLVTHSSLHTGIKPYVCECCSARFSCVGNLQQHRKRRLLTCGLPQYRVNSKAAPRPSLKNNLGRKITKRKKDVKISFKSEDNKNSDNKESKNGNNVKKENDSNSFERSDILPDQVLNKVGSVIDTQVDRTLNSTDIDHLASELKTIGTVKKTRKRKKLLSPEANFKLKLRSSISQPKIEKIEDQSGITGEPENKPKDVNLALLNICNSESSNDVKYDCDNIVSENDDNCNIKEEMQNPELKLEWELYGYQPLDVLLPISAIDIETDEVKDENILENDTSLGIIKHNGSDDEESSDNEGNDSDNYSINTNEDNTQSDEDYSILKKSKKQGGKVKNPTAITRKQKGNQEHKCSLCPKIYFHRTKLLTHLKNIHKNNEEIYKSQLNDDEFADSMKCKYCERRYKTIYAYKNHLKEHGPDGKLIYKSVCCREYFATEDEAKKHTETVHYDRITCFDCDRSYSDPHALQRHKYSVHKTDKKDDVKDCASQTQKLQCKMCTRKFGNKTALTDHERSNCGKNPLYKCEECGKHYHSAGTLKSHISLHTGEKPHLCQFCGKSFRTIHQVRNHQMRHSGDKPYKCEMCPKAFAYRSSLINHFSSHTGQRRFECKHCGMRFSCISNLQAHRKTKSRMCGNLPNDTKPIEYIGVVGGTIALGNKYTQQFKKRVKEVF